MEVRAVSKYVRVQPRKVRIIADELRGKDAAHSVALLRYHTSKGAKALRKVLVSAMANAQENHGLNVNDLKIATIMVDEGPRLKRMQARAMGRGNRIIKKTSHITVVVEDAEPTPRVRPHGTKAKPRPTFAAPSKGRKKGAAGKPAAAPVEEAPAEIAEAVPEVVETAPVAEAVEPAIEAPEASAAPEEISEAAPEEPATTTTEETAEAGEAAATEENKTE